MTKSEEAFKQAIALLDLPDLYHVGAFFISQGIVELDAEPPATIPQARRRQRCYRCPVAQYLHRAGFPYAVVGIISAYLHEDGSGFGEKSFYVDLPAPVTNFIDWSDLLRGNMIHRHRNMSS